MFIAMNRFKIVPGKESEFEKIWQERDSQLEKVPGFKTFNLLRGDTYDDHTLYSSHTVWVDRNAFDAWTHSEAFKHAHKSAGRHSGVYLGHPDFEGFDAVI